MKKQQIIASFLICASIFSVVPAQAAVSNKTTKKESNYKIVAEYSLDNKEDLYKYGIAANCSMISKNPFNNGEVIYTPNYYENPSDAKIIVKPIYRTYTNETTKAVAEIMVAYLVSKLPTKITKNTLLNWFVTKMTKMTDSIHPTYVGSWMWTSGGRTYATLVHYTDGNYSTPQKVQIIDVTNY